MTEQFKTDEREKEINRILEEALDPLDWSSQVAFMSALIERLKDHLPTDITDRPAEQYASYIQELTRALHGFRGSTEFLFQVTIGGLMPSITGLLNELDEREMAQRVGLLHDEARMRYPLHSNTVHDFDEFSRAIAEYYDYHFTSCISGGGHLSLSEAAGAGQGDTGEGIPQKTRGHSLRFQ